MSNPNPPVNSKYDIEAVGKQVRAGVLSIKEIARQHGCSDTLIRKWRDQFGWKRDLSDEVRKRTKDRLVRDQVRAFNAHLDDDEIVEEASRQQADVVISHRKDINALRAEEQRILQELGDNPTKLWVGQYKGGVIQHEVGIAVTERAAALQALANVQHKRIQLERQAFNLDDGKTQDDEIEEIKVSFVKANHADD